MSSGLLPATTTLTFSSSSKNECNTVIYMLTMSAILNFELRNLASIGGSGGAVITEGEPFEMLDQKVVSP